jgi:CarboxypepD_reg-like domain/TonB-dependent Receptor Plug Domain
MIKSLLTLFILAGSLIGTSAQTVISGKVTDGRGEAIPGANVTIQDSYDGASSGMDGLYQFKTIETGDRVLSITYIGYKPFQQNITLKGQPLQIDIRLKEEINQLDAVVISAGSFTAGEEKRRTVLKALDIATTAGATADIAGALNTLPGTQKVGESGRLFVRGGDGNETRTFIDGMVVLDAYGPAAPNTPSRGRFLPFMFKGTSFSTGGYSAEYGQALSSALVLNSKDKAETIQTDIDLLSVGMDLAHTQVWDRSSLSGKVQYTDLRPYFHVMDQRVDWKTPAIATTGTTAFRQQIGKDGMLKLFGNFSDTRYSLYDHDIARPELKQLIDLSNRYGYGNAAYQQGLGEKWNIRGGVSYSYNENATKIEDNPINETEKGIHSKVVLENSLSDRVELRIGGEAIVRDYAASVYDALQNRTLTQSFNETITSSFAEVEAFASKHLVAKAGARVEYNNLNQQAGVDPRLSVAYKPGSKGQFSFAYGRFRQSAKNQYIRANHELLSEGAEHFILNYQLITDHRTFRVETYYKKYFDLVKFGNSNPLEFTNAGNGYAKGVELFWRDNKSLKNVDYWVSYSLLDTKRDYLNFPTEAVPSFASRHNLSVVYKHFIPRVKSQIGATYSYSSGRPYYNPNAESFNSDRTPSYQDLSANISYLPKSWLIIHLSCTNLLGRDNIFGYQYASTPDADGVYARRATAQPAKHMLLLGVFITLSKNKSINQLPNL